MIRYRYRVYPTPDQQVLIGQLFGCVRVAYNDALALRKTHYRLSDFERGVIK